MTPTRDLNIAQLIPLETPADLLGRIPAPPVVEEFVTGARSSVVRILAGDDPRMLVVVGPCSIHGRDAALEYAAKLRGLAAEVADQLFLVMRVYFEKPRTTLGWKGLINDPHLNDTFAIDEGLRLARTILLEIAKLGVPSASEMLEPITPQYIADLITLGSIGARTTESPTHRQMASGLSMPIGFKNSTEGAVEVAVNAMKAAREPHRFLGIDGAGRTCVVESKGNPWGHLILRGGRGRPNYDADSLADAARQLAAAGVPPRFLVDCSHANSSKDYTRQGIVWRDVIEQRVAGNRDVIGLMLESNLRAGQQKLGDDPAALEYGVSITDGCIGWDETEQLIREAHAQLKGALTTA